MRERTGLVAVLAVLWALGANALTAHHSFAMFDTAKPLTLTGVVTAFEWTNPHAFIHFESKDPRNNETGNWQAELNARLRAAIAFLYGNFVRGVRRVVIDGIEPADRPGESIQFNLFEYIYHQILRKDPEWVARDLFREAYRRHADEAARHTYNPAHIGCLLLYTSHETMLDDLISRPLDEGDVLSNANTLIYMGKIRDGNRLTRGLYIAKHRGSACDERIVEYQIGEKGLLIP